MGDDDFYRVPKWHAPRPNMPDIPMCGTVNARGGFTHRIAKTLRVTCDKCLKAIEKAQRAGGGTP